MDANPYTEDKVFPPLAEKPVVLELADKKPGPRRKSG